MRNNRHSSENLAKVRFPQERARLLRLADRDQYIRKHGDFNNARTVLQMAHLDLANQRQLIKILDIIKAPSIDNVGADGAEAIWLITQHAAYDLKLMKHVLKLMTRLTAKRPEQAYHRGIPYLQDRISIMEGEPQLYGTQFWLGPSGTPEPYPIRDPRKVDTRRRRYSLPPMRAYRQSIVSAHSRTRRRIYLVLY